MAIHERVRNALFAEILDQGIDLRVEVTGQSMAPALRSGEVILVKKTPAASLRLGDLILFRTHAGTLVLHRLLFKKHIDAKRIVFYTKGDALNSLDAPVQENEILGRVTKIQRKPPNSDWKSADLDSFKWRRLHELMAIKHLVSILLIACRLNFGHRLKSRIRLTR